MGTEFTIAILCVGAGAYLYLVLLAFAWLDQEREARAERQKSMPTVEELVRARLLAGRDR